jgi:hypothetical protein
MSVSAYHQGIESHFYNNYLKIAKLNRNLAYADEALSFVNHVLPLGSCNRGSQNEPLTHALLNMRAEWKTIFSQNDFKTELEYYKQTAECAMRHGIGNCGEMSSIAFSYLRFTKNILKVERLAILGGDHAFNVIGRDVATNVSDPRTWGTETVVLDAWANIYYPANEIFDRMVNHNDEVLYDPSYHVIGFKIKKRPYAYILELLSEKKIHKLEYAKLWRANINFSLPFAIETALSLDYYIEAKQNLKRLPTLQATLRVKEIFFTS